MSLPENIRKKLSSLPHKPGAYLMRDRFGTAIYVGKARDLRKRVTTYFQPSRRMGWDLKFRALVDAICDFDFHVVRSEPEALLLESRLIKEFHPRYNVSFRDDKRFLMLKVNLNDPIPRFTLTRLKQDDGARYFGPFPNSGALRSTLALVRRQFHLRGCRPLTPTERDYRHCLYAHLKYCTAPCIGNVTRDQYLDQVRAACDFLAGQCAEMQEQLEGEMKKAAAAQDYERAAELRDLLSDLKRTTRKTEKFERIPYSLPPTIDPERDLADLAEALGLPAPPQRIEGFDISNISGTFAVASLVRFKNGRPDRANYRRFKIKTVTGQDDFASMAEVVSRRFARLENAAVTADEFDESFAATPNLVVVDGGKGQLAAALAAMQAHDLPRVAVIALAKREEEVFVPGRSDPIVLERDSPGLQLLQRIRDEAHRFALGFHRQRRDARARESIFDRLPGVGPARRRALIRHFGSADRFVAATQEELEGVPGIPPKTARAIYAQLHKAGRG